MKKKLFKNKYGWLGLLALLGFIGVLSEERWFLCFFFWILDFRYFFVIQDEAFDNMMRKAASNAFFIGLFICVTGTLINFIFEGVDKALKVGCTWGFVSSIVVFTLLLFYYEQAEDWKIDDED